jgi:hypothetical protein
MDGGYPGDLSLPKAELLHEFAFQMAPRILRSA